MADAVDVIYKGRRLKADLVTLIAGADAARLFQAQLDTDGNMVPVWKAHSYDYDSSGNQVKDTVTDGDNTWVRTSTFAGGVETTDSGWVKQ